MCVQYQSSCAPKLARVNIGCPVVRTDGRAVYGHVITKFSGMGRFTYPWCSAGALRAPELRYQKACYIIRNNAPKWVLTPPQLPSCTFLRLLLILLFSRAVPALSLSTGETVEKDRYCIINNRSHARYVEQC